MPINSANNLYTRNTTDFSSRERVGQLNSEHHRERLNESLAHKCAQAGGRALRFIDSFQKRAAKQKKRGSSPSRHHSSREKRRNSNPPKFSPRCADISPLLLDEILEKREMQQPPPPVQPLASQELSEYGEKYYERMEQLPPPPPPPHSSPRQNRRSRKRVFDSRPSPASFSNRLIDLLRNFNLQVVPPLSENDVLANARVVSRSHKRGNQPKLADLLNLLDLDIVPDDEHKRVRRSRGFSHEKKRKSVRNAQYNLLGVSPSCLRLPPTPRQPDLNYFQVQRSTFPPNSKGSYRLAELRAVVYPETGFYPPFYREESKGNLSSNTEDKHRLSPLIDDQGSLTSGPCEEYSKRRRTPQLSSQLQPSPEIAPQPKPDLPPQNLDLYEIQEADGTMETAEDLFGLPKLREIPPAPSGPAPIHPIYESIDLS